MTDRRRITLVARDPRRTDRDWDFTNPNGSHIVFVDSLKFLAFAIDRSVARYDVERVIVDSVGSAQLFLEFLTGLPVEFSGDVLYIGSDDKQYLSSTGRGDGRFLYSLTMDDLRFYLHANNLTWPEVKGEARERKFVSA